MLILPNHECVFVPCHRAVRIGSLTVASCGLMHCAVCGRPSGEATKCACGDPECPIDFNQPAPINE
jgi:hypothetical protein